MVGRTRDYKGCFTWKRRSLPERDAGRSTGKRDFILPSLPGPLLVSDCYHANHRVVNCERCSRLGAPFFDKCEVAERWVQTVARAVSRHPGAHFSYASDSRFGGLPDECRAGREFVDVFTEKRFRFLGVKRLFLCNVLIREFLCWLKNCVYLILMFFLFVFFK